MKRTVLKVTGESGQGLVSVGRIVAKILKDMGFYVYTDREYPSLIKGGKSNLQIDFGLTPIRSSSRQADLVIALDLPGVEEYVDTLREGGVLVHGYERHHRVKNLHERAEKRGVKLVYMPARTIAYEKGGTELMVNMVLLGLMWRILGFDLEPLEAKIKEQFKSKPKLLAIDLECVHAGYGAEEAKNGPSFKIELPKEKSDTIMIDGNAAIALGAVQAGVRAYFAYPMSPSSSILMHLANWAGETGMLVKQAEDEITAAQMALGSMYMGARALTGTSGGGFDLMTETVSLAGITETPLVIVVAQRPGPATGLPTWTCQGDLDLAIHAGHGEYGRMVMAVSDPESAYAQIQHAMNYAEKFQVPVVLLTEKVIAEAQITVPPFRQGAIPIERGLVTDEKEREALVSADRFRFTESGVSKRWIPGSAPAGYFANGDEHAEDGALTEEAEPVKKMIEKRLRKLETIKKSLPDPEFYGPESAPISLIGWGGSKGPALDALDACAEEGIKANYLHFEYLYPLRTEKLKSFLEKNPNVHLIEGNYFGQLGRMIEAETGKKFAGRLLKYDGRPFYAEEVADYLRKNI